MRNNSLAARPVWRARETITNDVSFRSRLFFSDESKWLHRFSEENSIALYSSGDLMKVSVVFQLIITFVLDVLSKYFNIFF